MPHAPHSLGIFNALCIAQRCSPHFNHFRNHHHPSPLFFYTGLLNHCHCWHCQSICELGRWGRDSSANPSNFARRLFEKPRSGTLNIRKDELNDHLVESYADAPKNTPLKVWQIQMSPRVHWMLNNQKGTKLRQFWERSAESNTWSELGTVYCLQTVPKAPPKPQAGSTESKVHMQGDETG